MSSLLEADIMLSKATLETSSPTPQRFASSAAPGGDDTTIEVPASDASDLNNTGTDDMLTHKLEARSTRPAELAVAGSPTFDHNVFEQDRNDLSRLVRRPASSSGLEPRKSMTLKEQAAKVDTLTNENFALKLKIHFLDDALQKRSEDGVKDLIERNVALQTDLANERKDSLHMRRKIRDMQAKIEELTEALMDANNSPGHKRGSGDEEDDPTLQAEMHEEILYLRQQLDRSENTVTTLREEIMTKEFEKRKMAEHMRSLANKRGETTSGMKETMDMWTDLLNAETSRREQAEEEASKLRAELNALRLEHATPKNNNSTNKNVLSPAERRRSRIGSMHAPSEASDEFMRAAEEHECKALVDQLKEQNSSIQQENEQLKHENEELRRDLGAQTSMLTSRNRERERLQQEIEDLRLLGRKFDGARSVAGESIFDRSISRAHQRSQSRASDHTAVTEAERDEWDKKEGRLRDANAELRIQHQELQRTHKTYLQYVQTLEGDFAEMENELNEARDDALKLQTERDEALKAYDTIEAEYNTLKEEALSEIKALDNDNAVLKRELDSLHDKHEKVSQKLMATTDDYKGLQNELRQITQSVMNLEDIKQHNMRTISTLEQQISEAEEEIQSWEQKCSELDQKNTKLEITEESLHNEVTFLREEQEGDKIKIGELEEAVNAARQQIQDEQEKLRDLESSILEERQQRDVLENKSKEEVQKILDDLNTENTNSKDEVRKLRRSLSAKEIEANGFKQKLEELEHELRNILGNKTGSKPSLLADIEKLQRELETTSTELVRVKMDLANQERLLRHRDGLLESSSLESRRLSDLLDKERASRKRELEQFEKTSRGQASHMRTIAQKESRVLELETAYTQAQRKTAALEQQFGEHLHERNILLLALWNRLSTLCGSDWAQNHALLNGEQPSVEVISRHLPSFNKNIIEAVRTVEALVGNFKSRIRNVEKDLWRDYQTLKENLEMRCVRMDNLEVAVNDTQRQLVEEQQRPQASRTPSIRTMKGSEEIGKLKSEVKLLKAELKFHRQHPSPMAQQMINQQAQMNPMSAEHARRQSTSTSPARQIVNSLLRHHSTSAVESIHSQQESENTRPQSIVLSSPPIQPSEQRWVHRLKELERRLKAEREARLLDRRGARQRLEEAGMENEELRRMLNRQSVSQEFEEEE